MTIPILAFGFILASLYGALFHLWKNGGLGRLILYLVLSWIGFWAGQILARQLGWNFGNIGTLQVGFATLGSILLLLIGHWLSLVQVARQQ